MFTKRPTQRTRWQTHSKRTGATRDSARQTDTSWQKVNTWYNKIVGDEGHYYHEHVVLPGVIKLLGTNEESSLVDIGCGQGVLARQLPKLKNYLGIDNAPSFITEARKSIHKPNYSFQLYDATKKMTIGKPQFTHAAIVLALQNMENAEQVINNAAQYLLPGGKLVIVLNHPCFRIPRQSGWNTDDKTKLQTRWMNRYLSFLKIPINMHPGKKESAVTWSFHHPLSDYTAMLKKAGFVITALEEWTSDKQSEGKAARMENRARSEFPLFLAIQAEKK